MKKIHYKMQLVITLFLIGLSMPFVVQAQSSCPSFKDDFTDGSGYSDSEFNVEPSAERRAHIQESLSALGYSNSTNENRNLTQNKLLAELSSSGTENNTELTEEEISRLRTLLTLGDEDSSSTVMRSDECSPDPDLPLMRGDNTPLHNAAQWGHVDFAASLIECGASLDIRNSQGWTPLHTASAWGHVNVAELLLSKGANPYIMTTGVFKRETPRDLAANKPYMLQLFDDYEVKDISYCKYLAVCPHRLFH